MAGASRSRLQKAGGDLALAKQSLADEYAAGARGWSGAQRAAYENPATREAFVTRQIGQSTKGKYSGVLGKIANVATKAAPFVAPLIPGVGLVGAGLISAAAGKARGKSLKASLLQGAGSAAGSALLGGKGIKGVGAAFARAKNLVRGGAGTAATAAAPGGKSFLSKAAGTVWGAIKSDPLKAAQLGLAGLGTIQAGRAGGRQNALLDRSLGALGPGTEPAAEDLSTLFADEANPYARRATRGRAARAATASLGY